MWGYFRVQSIFYIVKRVSPDGFFVIQILPNSITAGGACDTHLPIPHPSRHLRRLTTMSTSGLHRWAKFGWNLCCYACCLLSLPRNTRNAPRNRYVKTWRHPRNWKYITYRNASRGEPSHSHMQHAPIRWSSACGFRVTQADRQTDGQLNRHTHHNTSHT